MLKDVFIKNLKDKVPNYEDFYKIVDYISSTEIIVENKYGRYVQRSVHLLEGKKPSISTALDKIQYVKNVLYEKFSNYSNFYEVIDYRYIEKSGKLLGKVITKDEFGLCSNFIGHLKMKKLPRITSALNKQEYFKNKLLKQNKYYRMGTFEVIGMYTNNSTPIIVRTEFGDCLVKPANLLQKKLPTINSAICKTTYFLNKLKKTCYNVYKTYNFEKFVYKNNTHKSTIVCNKHGFVEVAPCVLLRGGGCEKCGYDKLRHFKRHTQDIDFSHSSWVKEGNNSKNFDSFKVYIIKCFNGDEEFYKIGKTFLKFNERFYPCNMPYEKELIKIFESFDDGLYISKLERKLQEINKKFKYIPKIKFPGMYECFKKVSYEL